MNDKTIGTYEERLKKALTEMRRERDAFERLASEQGELLNTIKELINDEHITKSETVDKISSIVNV